MGALILIVIAVGGVIITASMVQNRSNRASDARQDNQLEDAVADVRRWTERLGSQVLNLAGTDSASTQTPADASERYSAASSQISTARTPSQVRMVRESAPGGLHYINAVRKITDLPAGPALLPLEGQEAAGSVTEMRTIEHEGHSVSASPYATPETPNYYPGGRVAGRPVPAGWYSEPWWKPALRTGVWIAGSMLLFSILFHGMAGVAYGVGEFTSGMDTGADDFGGTEDFGSDDFGEDDLGGDFGGDATDAGDAGDGGGLSGGGDGGDGSDGGGFLDGGFDGFDIQKKPGSAISLNP